MSRVFNHYEGVAAALPMANVDTDKILPARFLKTTSRLGLGNALFHAMRFDAHDAQRPEFVLNRPPWDQAGILIALENFGCGSSREHAPWALSDFGIRAIVAPSFADIFHNNCFRNGILPIALDREIVDTLMHDALDPQKARMTIDLPSQRLVRADGSVIAFAVAAERKDMLLRGLDEIAESEAHLGDIDRWEMARRYPAPAIPVTAEWL